jgi:hypothetical protein
MKGNLCVATASLMRGRDAHIFAIFCHSAPGQLNSLCLQHRGQLVIGQWTAGIFIVDQLADFPLQQ